MRQTIKVLDIDLTNEKIEVIKRTDLNRYLGGTALAVKLYSEQLNHELDPLDPEQPVILANGPLNTIFPVVTKVVAVFRSPLTGGYGESHAGMRLGLAMRGAGINAIIIRGKAKRPTYLVIGPRGVQFKDASAIWGLDAGETGTILRRLVPGRGHRSCIRIGPAGENLVTFANVNVDTYRHFGRLGMGAVFGSKNLKAVVIFGDKGEEIQDIKGYRKVYEQIYQKVVNTEIMDKYHGLGTAINVLPLNALNALPTENMQKGTFEAAENISGESFAEKTLLRQIACSGCPIGCIHLGLFREEFGSNYEYKFKSLSYDFELIFALGSYLGITEINKVYQLIDLVEELGMDAITAGVALGWVTEAFKKGFITEDDLKTRVAFNDTKGYVKVLENIVHQPNSFYKLLAKGTEAVAQKYGGLDFAMTMGKNEMAGYHTGHAHVFGQSIGARHSHLDNAGYSIDQKNLDQNPEKMVKELMAEEKIRNVLTSLCICLFARGIYDMDTVIEALGSVQIETTEKELLNLGEEIYLLKHKIRTRLGFRLDDLRFPKRFFETPSLVGQLKEETIAEMLEIYKKELDVLSKK
ncbi:aldehyde:ferredoxin oxidoreductase [Desulfitispora alkaliphila]|uniref:aldehyde ferredoxin oxidoreductase family protein n=1 Tax=Desulfitispora alkaliphila TaxID=622674 RepID=UPI003D24C742